MKSLITGGAGFIGSNLVKVLVERGDEVTVLDNFSVGRLNHLTDYLDNIKVVKGSVCDIDLMRKLISGTDTVFHLAVECLMRCNSDIRAHEVNVGGTFNACLAAQESHAKMVYVSSSEVYGTCKIAPMTENHPLEPQSIYGLSKLIGEEYVTHFNKYYGLPAVIIRPFNTYGPNHRDDAYSAVITAFIRRLEKGESLIIEGTGDQSRDFTYVSDTAEGIAELSKLEHGEIVNIGSGNAISINDLASTLKKIYSMENCEKVKYYRFRNPQDIASSLKKIYGKEDVFINPRPNDVFKLEADISLAKAHGYKPRVSMEEGLRKYMVWWRK